MLDKPHSSSGDVSSEHRATCLWLSRHDEYFVTATGEDIKYERNIPNVSLEGAPVLATLPDKATLR
jgi:hypothetical protein